MALSAEDWQRAVVEQVREFGRTRRTDGASVQIVLDSGEAFFIQNAVPLADDLVALSVYTLERGRPVLDAMINTEDGDRLTPRVVVLSVSRIRRVEILARAPGGAPLGFQLPAEP